MNSAKYPYYIVVTHKGRLSVPLQYRGTAIAKQFASGRIGGSRAIEHPLHDSQKALAFYKRMKREDSRTEMFVIDAPNKPRRRIPNPSEAALSPAIK